MYLTDSIREFREAMDLPVYDKPTLLSEEERAVHLRLIQEEFDELKDAFADGDLVEVYDAIADIIYVTTELGVHSGLNVDVGVYEAHNSNMTKLWEDGKSRKDEGGKVIKPPHYTPARFDLIIEDQEAGEVLNKELSRLARTPIYQSEVEEAVRQAGPYD